MSTNNQHILSLLPAFILVVLAGFTSSISFAQNSESTKKVITKSSSEIQKTKTIEVENINGEKVVTVTTIQDGEKTVMIYKGEEAEKFLQKQNTHTRVIKQEDLEDMEFSFNVEGMEKGDTKKVIIISSDLDINSEDGHSEIISWTTDEDEEHSIDIKDMNVNVTDGENGEPMKIEMSYTDENGKKVEKLMVIDQTEVAKTMKDVEEILQDMNIDIDIDMDVEGDDGKQIKTVVVSKKIIVNEEEVSIKENSGYEMFTSFKLSPNPSKGQVKLAFETAKSGKVKVQITGIDGHEIFTDSFNGIGNYSKTISLDGYQGVLILTINQGENVEVKKIIIE